MKDTTSNNTPRQKKAAILPPAGIFLISNTNSFTRVSENNTREIILSGRNLYFMPSHINAKEQRPQIIGRAVFIKMLPIFSQSALFVKYNRSAIRYISLLRKITIHAQSSQQMKSVFD